ncbi:TPA: XRE family transcriptional regulator [Escherichia coli]
MTGWELRIWRKSMLWSREKAAREFGVTQRTWHAWENAVQVDVTVWRTTQALSAYSALFDHGLASKSDQRFASIRSTGNLTFSTAF